MVGIYKITNPDYHVYIGQSLDIKRRISQHENNCTNEKLKESIKKYGFEKHTVEVICECEPAELSKKESFYISEYQRTHTVLNGSPTGKKPIKDRGEIKDILTISIEEKYLTNQDKEQLRTVAYSAIVGFINNQKTK